MNTPICSWLAWLAVSGACCSAQQSTNNMWLEVTATTNTASVVLRNTLEYVDYSLLSRTTMNSFFWNLETNLVGLPGTNYVSATIAKTGRPSLILRVVRTDLDSDSDGIPDWWCLNNGLDPNAHVATLQSAAGDGQTNLQKYLARRNPNIADPLVFFAVEPKATSPIP